MYRFTSEQITMPGTESPYLYIVADGSMRLYTPAVSVWEAAPRSRTARSPSMWCLCLSRRQKQYRVSKKLHKKKTYDCLTGYMYDNMFTRTTVWQGG